MFVSIFKTDYFEGFHILRRTICLCFFRTIICPDFQVFSTNNFLFLFHVCFGRKKILPCFFGQQYFSFLDNFFHYTHVYSCDILYKYYVCIFYMKILCFCWQKLIKFCIHRMFRVVGEASYFFHVFWAIIFLIFWRFFQYTHDVYTG